MSDALRKRLKDIKAHSESARRRVDLYCDIASMGDKKMSQSLGALQKAPAPGKKLQKIGFIMLWIPEPTGVTCAVGAPMIIAGRYMDKKYNGSTIADVGHQVKSATSEISDFRNSLG